MSCSHIDDLEMTGTTIVTAYCLVGFGGSAG